MRRHALTVLKIAAGVVAAAIIVLVLRSVLDNGDSEPTREAAQRSPGEYLYLDVDRVDAYLNQLVGGAVKSETRTERRRREVTAAIKAATAFELGGSLESEEGLQLTVEPGAADRFYSLHSQLLKIEPPLKPLDIRSGFIDAFARLTEGDFIEIRNARLKVPSYAALFPQVSYARQELAAGQRPVRRRLLAPINERQRAQLRRYFRLVGNDPRMPFVITAQFQRAQCERLQLAGCDRGRVKIFLPLRSSRLALEPALMTGRLRIIGKIIHIVRSPNEPSYFDFQTFTAFGRALRHAPFAIRERLRLSVDGRQLSYRQAVKQSATVSSPGMVVIPIAIFK